MRIHRVRLKNYRGVSECTVELPDEGVTVIEGDNEIGKTSIAEAVALIFSELDSSGKRQVKSIRPVHRDAGPEVEVEITTGEYRFTYCKRWHRTPQTKLELTTPNPEQLTGREAHARVEAILGETLDQDLWEALTVRQGATLGQPHFGGGSLGKALDAAAGGDEVEAGDDALWDRICEERLKYWTRSGRPNLARKSFAGNLDEAKHKKGQIENQLDSLERDSQEAAQRAAEASELVIRSRQATTEEEALDKKWQASHKLRSTVERLTAEFDTARAQQEKAEHAYADRKERISAVDSCGEILASLEAEMEQTDPDRISATEYKQKTEATLAVAREALSEAQEQTELAREDRDYYRNLIEKDQLTERHERVLSAQNDLRTAETILDSSQVDNELVDEIELATIEVARAEAALKGSASVVEARALSAVSVEINGAKVELNEGEANSSEVTDEWELLVPNIVRVRVEAGPGSRDLSAELRDAEERHSRLCARGGVGDLAEARRKADERKEAERTRKTAKQRISEDLRDLTPEVLASKVHGLAKRTAAYAANRGDKPALPGSFENAKQTFRQSELLLERCQNEFDRSKEHDTKATDALQEVEVNAAVDKERLRNASDALAQAEQRLVDDRQNVPDSILREALADAQRKAEQAAVALKVAEKELAAQDPDSIEAMLENARNVSARVQNDLTNNRQRQDELRGRLNAQGEAGLHSQLNEVSSKVEQALMEYESFEARAEAASLLYETFKQHRQEAHQRYIKPFKEQVDKLGRIVFGPTFEVELDTNLRVAKRTLDNKTLDIEQLSVGAREQIGVICRLACAIIVSPNGGGAPVMVDDALGWSDPSRLQAMGAAIAVAGRSCQVIVLTCTPGRYAQVGNAKVIQLPTN